ncbi:molybdate/tungstate transport system substrate-binding protein [Catenulispora sp. MAP12-49]|jgi:molybdate/tungstate transport system substrate-binding protein|uniref:substrate-binding domain-containing protein n=1 Tax=unclassified Catenulispora TaxID=414885 RepID=UPI003512672C
MKKTAAVVVATGLLLAGCSSSKSSPKASPGTTSPAASTSGATSGSSSAITASGPVKVAYAASLANLMEHDLGPAYDKATGGDFQGDAAGSTQLVTEIKGKVKQADVFISASTDANTGLTGDANGGWESWYATFGTAPLVIAYNPNSKFAADIKSKPWNQVITEAGFKMGSTDPKLDPKGKLAAQALTKDNIPASAVQVFPEEQLVGRLQSGQLDAGFFYSSEAAELNIPTVELGDIKLQATYTVSVLNKAPDADSGIAFVQYLLSDAGKAFMTKHGLQLQPVKVTGDAGSVPAQLKTVLNAG